MVLRLKSVSITNSWGTQSEHLWAAVRFTTAKKELVKTEVNFYWSRIYKLKNQRQDYQKWSTWQSLIIHDQLLHIPLFFPSLCSHVYKFNGPHMVTANVWFSVVIETDLFDLNPKVEFSCSSFLPTCLWIKKTKQKKTQTKEASS